MFEKIVLKTGGPDRSWPPESEVYCWSCHRMVEAFAMPNGLGGGYPVAAKHYRFNIREMGRESVTECQAVHSYRKPYGPGQEDPQAAFRDAPKVRGWINTSTGADVEITATVEGF